MRSVTHGLAQASNAACGGAVQVLAAHGMPPSAPQLIGSPASPGYAPLPLQAVSRPQAAGALGLGMTDYSAGAVAPPASASAGPAQSAPGAGRLRRPTRRGPMDEMRQLVRILVKVRGCCGC